MKIAEMRALRKALSGMIGFLARGAAKVEEAGLRGDQPSVELLRGDGSRRRVAPAILSAAIARGLVVRIPQNGPQNGPQPGPQSGPQSGPKPAPATWICTLTDDGRAALKRMLADPDCAFQEQHRALRVRSDAEHGAVTVNDLESPLSALERVRGRDGQPFLAPDLVEAGERLRADFTRGNLTPSMGQNWEPVRAGRTSGHRGGINDLTDAALAARHRVEAAIADIGPDLSGVALDACCFLKGLSQIERERQWPARSAKLMLRTALSALARHYGAPGRKGDVRRPAPPPHAP